MEALAAADAEDEAEVTELALAPSEGVTSEEDDAELEKVGCGLALDSAVIEARDEGVAALEPEA